MIPELGHFALIVAMAFAICLSAIPMIGVFSQQQKLVAYARPLTFGMFVPLPPSVLLFSDTVLSSTTFP